MTENCIIYHNPRCSKSRNAVSYLEKLGERFEIVDYFKNPMTKDQLKSVIKKLGITPEELVRKGEPEFKANFKSKVMSNEDWIDALLEFPKLIERPIVIKKGKGVIARPESKIDELNIIES